MRIVKWWLKVLEQSRAWERSQDAEFQALLKERDALKSRVHELEGLLAIRQRKPSHIVAYQELIDERLSQ